MTQTTRISVLLFFGAVVLIGVGAGGVVSAMDSSAPAVTQAETVTVSNTTNYLSPSDPPSQQGYAQVSVDVTSAVTVGSERLHGRHDILTFERRFESENRSDNQLALVEETIATAETRLSRLDARHERLFETYTDGDISQQEFLRLQSRLNARAEQSRTLLEEVRTTVESDPDTTLSVELDTRLAALRAELVALPGPLTTRATNSTTGEAEPFTLYSEGVNDGVVFAAIDDGEFIRQATLRSEYTPGQPNQFAESGEEPITAAFDRARTLYPWVFDNLQSSNRIRIRGFGDSDVYLFDLGHEEGDLEAYIHGGSTNVFREHHEQRPQSSPVRLTARNESANLDITVSAGVETGPMYISVRRATADVPAEATIRVNGQPVGTTNAQGERWTVRPTGSFTVNATTDDGATVSVTPT